ncbi:ABC-three component system middle component 2 [Plesiomonas shigelloides]|uniref:ABC-three component system middle component 2 n=1 Tax=Plesiomonas shigelloides TaxID=703 RepID=UPI00387EF77C
MNIESVFNTELEAGIRTIAVLDAIYPLSIDFESLTKADFIIINSGDFGGPDSIHPSTPNKIGELATRREIIRTGIKLMRRFGMIDVIPTNDGVKYKATQNAYPYLKLMRCKYSKRIIALAQWFSQEIQANEFKKFDLILSEMSRYE